MNERSEKQSNRSLFFQWLLHHNIRVVFLRVWVQLYRIISGRPLHQYSEITPQLYVGGQHRIHGWPLMQQEPGITAVINMRKEFDDRLEGLAPDRYLHLPTVDNHPPSLEQLREGVMFIEKEVAAGGVVYVHCGVGVGRAPTMVAAYLVSIGMAPREAWALIRRKRPFVWPMPGQMRQINRLYIECQDPTTEVKTRTAPASTKA